MEESDEAVSVTEFDEMIQMLADEDPDLNDPGTRVQLLDVAREFPEALGLKADPEIAARRKERLKKSTEAEFRAAPEPRATNIDVPGVGIVAGQEQGGRLKVYDQAGRLVPAPTGSKLAGTTSGAETQTERDYRELREADVIDKEDELELRYASRVAAAYGMRDVVTTVDVPITEITKAQENLRQYKEGLDLTDRMIALIDEDPSRAGFAASIRNFIDSGMGRLQAIGEVLGPDAYGALRFSQSEMFAMIANKDYEGSEADANQFMNIIGDESIAEMELLGLLLAFKMERNVTGGRRFSIEAVKKLQKELRLNDPRGFGVARRRLDVVRRMFRQRYKETVEDTKRLNALARGEVGKEGLFGEAPESIDLGPTGGPQIPAGVDYELIYDETTGKPLLRKVKR
jgi:hypothetical protein